MSSSPVVQALLRHFRGLMSAAHGRYQRLIYGPISDTGTSENDTEGGMFESQQTDSRQARLKSLLCTRRLQIGYMLVAMIDISWIFSDVIAQALQREYAYYKPFLFNYLFTAGMSVFALYPLWKYRKQRIEPNPSILCNTNDPTLSSSSSSSFVAYASASSGLSWRHLTRSGNILALVFNAANLCWWLGVTMTSVTSSNILYQTAVIFVFILSVFSLKETVTVLKVCSVLLAFVGVCLVVLADGSSGSDTSTVYTHAVIGDLIMLLSAFLWALYQCLFKYLIGDDATAETVSLVSGLMGISTAVYSLPVFVFLHFTGLETFSLPPIGEPKLWFIILAQTFFNTVLNSVVNFGVAYISPLFTQVGVMLLLPLSVYADILIMHIIPSITAILGTLLVLVGFLSFTASTEI